MNKMYRSLSAGLLTFVLLSPKLYATNPALEEAAYILALEEQMKTGRSIPESEYSKHKKWLFDESMRTTVFFLQGLSDTSSKEEKLKKIKEYKSRTAYTFESRKQQVRTNLEQFDRNLAASHNKGKEDVLSLYKTLSESTAFRPNRTNEPLIYDTLLGKVYEVKQEIIKPTPASAPPADTNLWVKAMVGNLVNQQLPEVRNTTQRENPCPRVPAPRREVAAAAAPALRAPATTQVNTARLQELERKSNLTPTETEEYGNMLTSLFHSRNSGAKIQTLESLKNAYEYHQTKLPHPKTLEVFRMGLADPDPAVKSSAIQSLEGSILQGKHHEGATSSKNPETRDLVQLLKTAASSAQGVHLTQINQALEKIRKNEASMDSGRAPLY
jgi:hypothetical protein